MFDSLRTYIKMGLIILLRVVLKVLFVFPVNNKRILFSSSEGAGFFCNPKYIFLSLFDKGLDCVWVLRDLSLMSPKYHVKKVKFLSIKHVYYLMTSKVIVSNLAIEPFVPIRKNQLVINTWHGGGAYKYNWLDSSFVTTAKARMMVYMRDVRAKGTNYLISSSERFSFEKSKEFGLPMEKLLCVGSPRNDLFFQKDLNYFRRKVCREYQLDESSILVLYAPTFRGYWRNIKHTPIEFDTEKVKKVIGEKFDKQCTLLFRHHFKDKTRKIKGGVDVSDYQDMQELLAAVDMLITDYSSSIWDFALTYKPGFLYTPDLEDYEKETKFYMPIRKWQYPLATNIADLCQNIERYDTREAHLRIKKHLKELGSYENGHATEKVCKVIEEWLNRSKVS